MSFFRTTGLVLISIALTIFLLASGILLTIGLSLNYDSVQKEVPSVLKQIFITEDTQPQINNMVLQMQMYCNQTNSENVTVPLNNSGFSELVIPCVEVYKGTDSVINYSASELVFEIYYKEYDCDGFRECVSDEITYLVSNEFRSELMHYSLILIIFCLFCFILVFFLAKKKSNFCFLLGGSFIGASLVLLGIDKLLEAVFSSFPVSQGINPSSFVNVFFSSSTSIFLIFLLFGLALIISGILILILAANRAVEDEEPV